MHSLRPISAFNPRCGLVLFLLVCLVQMGCGGNKPISSQSSKFEVESDSDATDGKIGDANSKAPETDPDEKNGTGAKSEEDDNRAASATKTTREERSPNESAEPESSPRPESGVYKPPKGPPSRQIEFIKKLSTLQPKGNSVQSQRIDFEDKMNAVISSCDLILADAKATSEEKQFAIQNKFFVLTEMSSKLQNDEYAEKAMTFAAELQGKEKGTVERELGVAIGVGLLPQQFSMVQKPTDDDVKKLIEGYLSYLAEGPLPPMYQPGLQIAKILHDMGKREKAIVVIEAMVSAYTEAKDQPDREKAVSELDGMLRIYQVDLANKVRAVIADEKNFSILDNSFEKLLKEDGSKSQWLEFVYGVGATLEKAGKTESAHKVYERLAKLNETAGDPAVGKQIKLFLENAQKRKALIGTTIDFTAQTAEKTEFQLSTVKGKPILVLFWAALDGGASFDELANIEQILLNSKSGFAVVLVNVDDEADIFSKFSELQKISWAEASVRCPDASKKGFESELEKQIGLDTLPFSLLLDADRKVASTFAQGARLEALVQSMIAEKSEKPEATDETPSEAPAKKAEGSVPIEKPSAVGENGETSRSDTPKSST